MKHAKSASSLERWQRSSRLVAAKAVLRASTEQRLVENLEGRARTEHTARQDMERRALSEAEVAERLGVSPFTVRAWRRRGHGPRFMKMGRAVRYRPEDVDAYKEISLRDPVAR
jgi:excisionase family DNA binding protein